MEEAKTRPEWGGRASLQAQAEVVPPIAKERVLAKLHCSTTRLLLCLPFADENPKGMLPVYKCIARRTPQHPSHKYDNSNAETLRGCMLLGHKRQLSNTCREHLVHHPLECVVLKSRGNSLLVTELLIDLIILRVRAFLHLDFDSVIRRQSLL